MFSAPPSSQSSGDGFRMAMDPSLPGASVLLTGGADGEVRQWELFFDGKKAGAPQGSDEEEDQAKLRHFPQIASQRLRRRVCQIKDAHGGAPVVAIAGDNSKIVSASAADGTVRAFSRTGDGSTGRSRRGREQPSAEQFGEYGTGNVECLLSMEGFDGGLSSVTFDKELLACDGMGSTLCLHDFAEIEGPVDAGNLDLGTL